jgi:hypothetical protein
MCVYWFNLANNDVQRAVSIHYDNCRMLTVITNYDSFGAEKKTG